MNVPDDTGFIPRSELSPADRARTEEILAEIEQLNGQPDAFWASATLRGIADTIRRTGYGTVEQERAVGNIKAAIERRRENGPRTPRGGSRRYEGFPDRSKRGLD